MDLFAQSGNTDIEGATIVNACYGGTAALLNAFLWCESDNCGYSEERPYAIVVAADIATYARGPARPTSGCGAVAVLVGRDAPFRYHGQDKATHASNVYDFYKPDHTVEYPTVDGALSQVCYYSALEDCYSRFVKKISARKRKARNKVQPASPRSPSSSPPVSPTSPVSTPSSQPASEKLDSDGILFNAESADFFVFHAPYNKLVTKSYARLFLLDARMKYEMEKMKEQTSSPSALPKDSQEEKKEVLDGEESMEKKMNGTEPHPLQEWLEKPIEETYNDRALDGVLKKLSAKSFQQRLSDANAASKVVGNTYTASVFLGLASLIDRAGRRQELGDGKDIVVFSYGSGALATMYRLQVYVFCRAMFCFVILAPKGLRSHLCFH